MEDQRTIKENTCLGCPSVDRILRLFTPHTQGRGPSVLSHLFHPNSDSLLPIYWSYQNFVEQSRLIRKY